MSDSYGVTVTFKAGGGYDAPWIVVRSPTSGELLSEIGAAFPGAVVPGDVTGTVVNAARHLHAVYGAVDTLGGGVVEAVASGRSKGPSGASQGGSVGTGGGSAWVAQPAPPERAPVEQVTDLVDRAEDFDALKKVWVAHAETIKADSSLYEKFKDRSATLRAGN